MKYIFITLLSSNSSMCCELPLLIIFIRKSLLSHGGQPPVALLLLLSYEAPCLRTLTRGDWMSCLWVFQQQQVQPFQQLRSHVGNKTSNLVISSISFSDQTIRRDSETTSSCRKLCKHIFIPPRYLVNIGFIPPLFLVTSSFLKKGRFPTNFLECSIHVLPG